MGSMTKFQKQSKLMTAYLEREEFKDSDLHVGTFCYNFIYWLDIMGGTCMVVSEEGQDVWQQLRSHCSIRLLQWI